MNRRINWNDLRFYLAVLRGRSLPSAALALGVSEATVSRRIAHLEEALGARLFDRASTGHTPTPMGERLRSVAEQIATSVDELCRVAAGEDSRLEGELVVTAPANLSRTWLFPFIAEFGRRYPAIELEVRETGAVESLDRRVADVAFRVTNAPSPGLVGRRVLRLAYATYKAPSAPERWVGWVDRRGEAAWLEGPYAHWPVGYRATSAQGAFAAVKAGLGAGRLECYLGDAEPAIERIDDAYFERGLWVLHHESLKNTARVRAFTDFMVERMLADKGRLESDAVCFRGEDRPSMAPDGRSRL